MSAVTITHDHRRRHTPKCSTNYALVPRRRAGDAGNERKIGLFRPLGVRGKFFENALHILISLQGVRNVEKRSLSICSLLEADYLVESHFLTPGSPGMGLDEANTNIHIINNG